MFINKRFYIALIIIVFCFIVSLKSVLLFTLAQVLLVVVLLLCAYEIVVLFFSPKDTITCIRECSERFSNGDDNEIKLHLSSNFIVPVKLKIIDEVPDIFQLRDSSFAMNLEKQTSKVLKYSLRPIKRGVYRFGKINVFVSTRIGLISRRFKTGEPCNVKVYPSFFYLKQYELMASSNKLKQAGNKRIKKIGQQLEPDQIKDYVKGDDYRIINWKATARRNKLMVNVFQEERAQNLYCVIDKGRTMQSAFEGMTLLDYSINASLALAYVAMLKGDKTGLLTFERRFDTIILPSRTPLQMSRIQEALYSQQTAFAESDYSILYQNVNKYAANRGLMLIFTNFDSVTAMQRQLRYLSKMAKRHSILVIFFEDVELEELINKQPEDKEQVYQLVIAEKLEYEKRLIISKLRKHNILSLLTHPNHLTVDVINKYLEIKARGDW